MSELILPVHLRPVIQNFNGQHIACLAQLDMIAGLVATVRQLPESVFERPDEQPVITPGLGLAIEAMGVLSAMLTLCSAEADMLMQENPGTFSIDGMVAQGVPLLLWITHGIHRTIRASVGIPAANTVTVIALAQNRHTLDRVCAAVDTMIHHLRQRFPHAVPIPKPNLLIN